VDQVPALGFVYFMAKAFVVYLVTQWIKGTFPRMRVDQMMSFAWKVLVPLVLALIIWQMLVQKLPVAEFFQYGAILVGNLAVIALVLRILGRHFSGQELASKRAFEPKSLIGTMEPVATSAGD